MSMMLFAEIYPELALAETRSIRIEGYPELPDDEYGLLESYCPDPKCDCRRVMLNVISRRRLEQGKSGFLASISYGFDRDDEFTGPMLDPLNPQSRYAEALLAVVEQMLADPAYVQRLEKHYQITKKAISDPDQSVRQKVTRFIAEENAMWEDTSADRSDLDSKKRRTRRSGEASSQGAGKERTEAVPKAMQSTYEAVVAATDAFCKKHLNEEYAQLSRKLAAALARKRPSPLAQGKPLTWACGIMYALGSVNFLWDKTQTPHMSAGELCEGFGVSKGTGSAKARVITKAFGMYQMDPRWCLPSKMDDNPYVWMLSVNGLLMDIRYAPREAQEEALRKGLIPYLPEPRRRTA